MTKAVPKRKTHDEQNIKVLKTGSKQCCVESFGSLRQRKSNSPGSEKSHR